MQTKVIFTGNTNDYTFRENIEKNSQGLIKKTITIDGRIMHQVEFENGFMATIDDDELTMIRTKV